MRRRLATCGSCGLTWDDGVITSMTPTPSGRCPFEYFHRYDTDDEPMALSADEIPADFIVRPVKGADADAIASARAYEKKYNRMAVGLEDDEEGIAVELTREQWKLVLDTLLRETERIEAAFDQGALIASGGLTYEEAVEELAIIEDEILTSTKRGRG